MKHKYTKILVFLVFSMVTACGTGNDSEMEDYSNEIELDVDNEKNIQYKPDGDYDTLSEIEKIAKDRRNHRKTTEGDLNSDDGDSVVEMNLQHGKEPHAHGSGKEEEGSTDTNFAGSNTYDENSNQQ